LLLPALILCFAYGCGSSGAEEVCYFDVPEGDAALMLKEAAKQAGVEIVFSSRLVADQESAGIRGNYRPSVAFELMLPDPSLVVMQHERSGIYTIKHLKME